jgi:hypothetical protein
MHLNIHYYKLVQKIDANKKNKKYVIQQVNEMLDEKNSYQIFFTHM